MVFCKPALPITDQIKLLIGRGMIIEDQENAAHHLAHMNYYRLRAYWLPFEETTSNGDHRFVPGVKWEDIEYLYEFDAKLRLLLLEAIGQVEVSLRTHWAYHLSLKYGSHAHEIPDVFRNLDAYAHHLSKLQAEYLKSVETFAEHYRNHYTELSLPPIWATCELMTLGELSRWYKNLKYADDRNAIVRDYGFDEAIMVPFFHHLTVVRNICAHHGRIWNRSFPFRMKIPRRIAARFNSQISSKIFNTITMLALLTEIINSNSNWSSQLFRLIKNHPRIDLNQMGFPQNWKTFSPWKSICEDDICE